MCILYKSIVVLYARCKIAAYKCNVSASVNVSVDDRISHVRCTSAADTMCIQTIVCAVVRDLACTQCYILVTLVVSLRDLATSAVRSSLDSECTHCVRDRPPCHFMCIVCNVGLGKTAYARLGFKHLCVCVCV